ncbi:hypothetical protein Z517_09298 [Fonsecaea pedrosoi CBS 271.37]|uniref:Uncharacterized protein n=1 Tax=Fonsecaea pedrosoi CBS 271.37 TaxID=1442368 RepID=A0A0D2GWW6_9EURO|nr:uncharacterized protein Z517_09298 [Fonsecaea pedrosoi CBS 271.37]KIW76854.1 hypothetical protein Z517_09298 [Fonsecaea pedrosoi CBS 271.37]
MSDRDHRKPLLLALAGAVALTVAYTYTQHAKPSRTEPQIRHLAAQSHEALAFYSSAGEWYYCGGATTQLNERSAVSKEACNLGNGYNMTTPVHRQAVDLTLIPSNLSSINDYLLQYDPAQLSPQQQEHPLLHLHEAPLCAEPPE